MEEQKMLQKLNEVIEYNRINPSKAITEALIAEVERYYDYATIVNQKNPVLDEMAKQLQLVYNFFNHLADRPKTITRKKKLTEDKKMELLIEEQEKKIELMEMAKMVKEGKISQEDANTISKTL